MSNDVGLIGLSLVLILEKVMGSIENLKKKICILFPFEINKI